MSAKKTQPVDSRGRRTELGHYAWQCVFDPTRTGEYPGDFYGGRLRGSDLENYHPSRETWPEGITYRNLLTGALKVFSRRAGKFVAVTEKKSNWNTNLAGRFAVQ